MATWNLDAPALKLQKRACGNPTWYWVRVHLHLKKLQGSKVEPNSPRCVQPGLQSSAMTNIAKGQ